MNRSRHTWWLVFAVCAVAVVAAMAWITVEMVRLERSESRAWSEAAHQEKLNLALWRMDSWFAPRLAREAARPYFDYRPFYPQEQAYTRRLSKLDPGEVLTPSPLLTFRSEFVRLHFQVSPDGSITSPQVPTGDLRNLAEDGFLSETRLVINLAELQRLTGIVSPKQLDMCMAEFEPKVLAAAPPPPVPPPPLPEATKSPRGQVAWQDFSRRQAVYVQNALDPAQLDDAFGDTPAGAAGGAMVSVGPLVPLWTERPDEPDLMFVRRVRMGADQYLQGFLCDWPHLATTLLGETVDLLPSAMLVPVPTLVDPGEPQRLLATIPARLDAAPADTPIDVQRPTRSILTISWLAVVAGLAAVAATLRASIVAGERRSRFASAVTHELRTPLTTFRMYSEMLADDMVQDEAKRRTYLQTLKTESERLSALVENVLAYARIERGQARIERRRLTIRALVEHAAPAMRQCAERAGMILDLDSGPVPDLEVDLDPEAVGQILLNLVGNACKYACHADDATVHVHAAVDAGRLTIEVRDHGPGIAPEHDRAIFTPFDRGARHSGDATPGVGLGLTLALGLARELGGDLRVHRPESGDGGAVPVDAAHWHVTIERRAADISHVVHRDVRGGSHAPRLALHYRAMPKTKPKKPNKLKQKQQHANGHLTAKRADRHDLYERSVQEPEAEIDLIRQVWKEQCGRECTSIREDFCGTAAVCMEWVKSRRKNTAVGVDLDTEVLGWAKKKIPQRLNEEQSARIQLIEADVRTIETEKVDSVLAMNFSYYLFMSRDELREYFKSVREALVEDGLFLMDAYGGSDSFTEMEEERDIDDGEFTYIWDQHKYDPITGRATNYIHFQFPDGSKLRKAFEYRWRLWTLPEIQEILNEAGFKRVAIYWEGTDEDGEGDGEWAEATEGEACPGWVAYLAAFR